MMKGRFGSRFMHSVVFVIAMSVALKAPSALDPTWKGYLFSLPLWWAPWWLHDLGCNSWWNWSFPGIFRVFWMLVGGTSLSIAATWYLVGLNSFYPKQKPRNSTSTLHKVLLSSFTCIPLFRRCWNFHSGLFNVSWMSCPSSERYCQYTVWVPLPAKGKRLLPCVMGIGHSQALFPLGAHNSQNNHLALWL